MNGTSRRAWVKNAAIVFLIVLLLLTFFSNTILNYSLPEVSVQYASYDSITNAIKVSGTVKANESYVVTRTATRRRSGRPGRSCPDTSSRARWLPSAIPSSH